MSSDPFSYSPPSGFALPVSSFDPFVTLRIGLSWLVKGCLHTNTFQREGSIFKCAHESGLSRNCDRRVRAAHPADWGAEIQRVPSQETSGPAVGSPADRNVAEQVSGNPHSLVEDNELSGSDRTGFNPVVVPTRHSFGAIGVPGSCFEIVFKQVSALIHSVSKLGRLAFNHSIQALTSLPKS